MVYAIEMAEEILKIKDIYIVWVILFSNDEGKQLTKGLKIIDHEELVTDESIDQGEPPSTYELAIKNNLTLIDASCPV